MHDGVDSVAHARIPRHAVAVNHVQLEVLLENGCLHRSREILPGFARAIRTVQQHRRRLIGFVQHLETLEKIPLMNRHKTGFANQVRRSNRAGTKTKVRDCPRARFFRIIDKITLGVQVCALANDLDRILVRANCAVRTQPVKNGSHLIRWLEVKTCVIIEAGVRYIIVDANRKMGFWLSFLEFPEDRQNHRWRKLFARESIPSTDHPWKTREWCCAAREAFGERGDHILVQGFARCAWFFGAIQHRNGFDGFWQCRKQEFNRERTVQAHFKHTDFFAARDKMIDRFFNGFDPRTHHHNHALGVTCANKFKGAILSSCQACKLVHHALHDLRGNGVKRIGGLSSLKIDIWVLRRTTNAWLLWF